MPADRSVVAGRGHDWSGMSPHTDDVDPTGMDPVATTSAYVDPLTGLGNRRQLARLFRTEPGAAPRRMSLLVVDLDDFKQVNDNLGHGVGDELLMLVAKRISAATREQDEVLRLGGDEFAILQRIGDQPEGAEKLANRIIEFLSRPFLVGAHQVDVGASVGIATIDGVATRDGEDLLRHADLAMYAAKDAGRGVARRFQVELEERAAARRELELHLRRALARRELRLVYQAKVRLPDQAVIGFEALLRWHNHALGQVSPVDFIPVAERLGEILPIGSWVLEQACGEAVGWPDDIAVAVNVSPLQFLAPGFVAGVAAILERTGLAAGRLELEITEGVLLDDPELALERLWALRELGVSVAMDDFGTGYASLAYLARFPFSTLKIDQSFVRAEADSRSRQLVPAIVQLGATLGMTTVAEGVETPGQLGHLAHHGCGEAQGYLFSRPLPPSELADFLAVHHRAAGRRAS